MHAATWRVLAAALLLLTACRAALANSLDTPASLPGAVVVSAEQVRTLVAGGAMLVDTRVGNEYAEAHIRGAVNIPYKEASDKAASFDATRDRFDLSRLPADKTKQVVFYCNSGDCWKSYKASTLVVRAGYTRVYWFRGGLPEWKRRGYPVD